MEKCVRLIHLGTWYKCYGDDAKVISFITNYKLFEDLRTGVPSVGFPEVSIDRVVRDLKANKINYMLVHDNDKINDYGLENNYDKFLFNDLPFSYVIDGQTFQKKPKGSFIVQYEGEEPEEFIINDNIKDDAELTKKIAEAEINDVIVINDYKIKVIAKNIDY